MKTRDQIYGKEAAELLRDITTYHYLSQKQLLRLYPGKEDKIQNLLSFFVKQGRIFFDSGTKLYHDGTEASPDYEMLAAVWVLADFVDRTEYHSSTDFPVKLIFIADGEMYEVLYAVSVNDALLAHALTQQSNDAEKRIVIVEDPEQIARLMIPDVTAYCTVDIQSGTVQYFKQE